MGRAFQAEVRGAAPVPQGSMRAFNGKVTHANSKLKAWRRSVSDAVSDAMSAMSVQALPGPIRIHVTFILPRPKVCRRDRPTVRPDCDKLVRAIGDALVDARAIGDDAQIVEIHAFKRYPRPDEFPGVFLFVEELT